MPKPENCRPMEKKYNRVAFFFSAYEKNELKSGTLSADRPTVGGVNVIAVLRIDLTFAIVKLENKNVSDNYDTTK